MILNTGQAQKAEKAEAEKKAEADKKAAAREAERKQAIKNQIRQPLSHVNRARLNDEQRQERRQQLFKRVKRQSIGNKKKSATTLEGVRLNRRFQLMMEMRNK